MAMGVPVPRARKVQALRRHLVDGCRAQDVAEELGVSKASIFAWKKDRELVSDAKALGPSKRADDAGEDVADPFTIDTLPADPSDPAVLKAVGLLYAVGGTPEDCDDLAGWDRGTVRGWIEACDAGEADEDASTRVRALRSQFAGFKGRQMLHAQTGAQGWQGAMKGLERRFLTEWSGDRPEEKVDPLDHLEDGELDDLLDEDLADARDPDEVVDAGADLSGE